MSFDLGVWHSDGSVTDEEAGDLYTKLCEEKVVMTGESGAVEAFYHELTSHWPEIDTVPEEKIDDLDNCPWSCALDRSGMHVIMACVWPKANEVAAFVYQLAMKHGLVLYNPQESTVYLPPKLKPQRSRFRFW